MRNTGQNELPPLPVQQSSEKREEKERQAVCAEYVVQAWGRGYHCTQRSHYPSPQTDEVWSCVGRRKKGKYWLLYAHSAPHTTRSSAMPAGAGTLKQRGNFTGNLRRYRSINTALITGEPLPGCCQKRSTERGRATPKTLRE